MKKILFNINGLISLIVLIVFLIFIYPINKLIDFFDYERI
jgi:hypothetical protein